jgi:hypothetical protein
VFPVNRADDLPRVDTSSELPELDFKRTVDPTDSIEMAKDVAALANTVGGSIIIGAETRGQRVTSYPGVPEGIARQAGESYETAVTSRCRPTPYLETRVLPCDTGTALLVVNVWLSPVAPVGVNIRQKLASPARLVDHAWVFPRRVGSQTTYLQPDQFGAFENMNSRRAAALLLGIPKEEWNRVHVRWSTIPSIPSITRLQDDHHLFGRLDSVSLEKNVVRFTVGNQHREEMKTLQAPLDWVLTVWRDDVHNEWQVALDADVVEEQGYWVAVQRVS